MSEELKPTFRVLPLGAVKPGGWILEQLNRDLQEGFASRLDELTEHASNDMFQNRVDTSTNPFAWWDSETRGNWLWGFTMMAYLSTHDTSQSRIDQLLAALKTTQENDGYIGIYSKADRYRHETGENGELWGQSRALLTMLAYYELTNDKSYLDAVERAVQLTMQHYGPGKQRYFQIDSSVEPIHITGLTHGLCYVDVVEWLYDITGNDTYRDFGVWLYQDFNSVPDRFANDDMKLANLQIFPLPFMGHAVHTAEHLRVLIWAYCMTADPELKRAIDMAIEKTEHYSTPSGALIGDEGIHGLPMPDMGYEYCTITELMFSLASALQKFGDSSYGDWIENLTFNAGQGARFTDGSGICYLSAENRLEARASRPDAYTFFHTGGRYKYSPTHEDVAVCCNPNAIRLMPHYVSRMWMRLNDRPGVAAVMYGPSTLTTEINGVRVTINQETHYPFSEDVVFDIQPDQEVDFALYLRKPAWSADSAVHVEGAAVSEDGGFLVLEKQWSRGDKVTVSFAAKIESLLYPNGEFGVRRGPLQYAMPIPHETEAIKSYPVPGFHDYDILPKDFEHAYQVIILDDAETDYGLRVITREAADMARPWDNPPHQLESESKTLVPMGCTVLRRSTFPLRTTR